MNSEETFLFDEIIFGPINSRRLGISLGINLLPTKRKICTFNCVYCECGFNEDSKLIDSMPTGEVVKSSLIAKIEELLKQGIEPNILTFAGNGEPTIHPYFEQIIDDTIAIRDAYLPLAKIAVLTNSTQLHKDSVFRALEKIENPILKLDGGNAEMVARLDNPNGQFSFEKTVKLMVHFGQKAIIQTMFIKGNVDGEPIDNTTEEEVSQWLSIIKLINPKEVMLYTLDRTAPINTLKKIDLTTLNQIALRVNDLGIKTQVSG